MTITSTATSSTRTDANGQAPTHNRPTALQLLRQSEAPAPAPAPCPVALDPALPATIHFSPEQLAALTAPLARSHVSSRDQGRGKVAYVQSWVVISEANRIFGFDGWQRQTLLTRCVNQAERPIGRDQKPGWGVTYIARVRITVGPIVREGCGAGHGIDADLGQAHESAIKEAETDAMKRALMTFGNPFGLALYDKSQRQVSGPVAPQSEARQPLPTSRPEPANALMRRTAPQANPVAAAFNGAARTAASTATTAMTRPAQVATGSMATARSHSAAAASSVQPIATAALNPATIQQLQERIRALHPEQVATFSQAFRGAFQVPESTPSIAGLITEQRHSHWIEQYLSQLSEG